MGCQVSKRMPRERRKWGQMTFLPFPNDLCRGKRTSFGNPGQSEVVHDAFMFVMSLFQGLSQPLEYEDALMTRQGYEDYAQGSLDVNEDYGEGSHKKRMPGYVSANMKCA